MAFSVSNAVSSSSNHIDGKKSLFLLKKIIALSELGYKTLNDKELNSTAENLIDVYLTLPDQASDNIKKELQGLKLVRSNLANYTIKEIFHAALSELTEVKQLNKIQEACLNQTYTQQFRIWMQKEIEHLPVSSILLLLNIYYGFNNLSIDLDTGIWEELLSLKGWNTSQKKSLNQFKSKYESLHFCTSKISLIKINNTMEQTEFIGDIKELESLYMSWRNLVELFVRHHLDEDQKKRFVKSLNESKKSIGKGSKTSDKESIMHMSKAIEKVLFNFQQIREVYREEIFQAFGSIPLMVTEIRLERRNCSENRDDETQQIILKILENQLQDFLKRADKEIQETQEAKSALERRLQNIQYAIDHLTLPIEEGQKAPSLKEREAFAAKNTLLNKNKQTISSLIERDKSNLQIFSEEKEDMISVNEKCISRLKEKNVSINKRKIQLLERYVRNRIHDLSLKERGFLSIISLSKQIIDLLRKEDFLVCLLENA